MNVMEQCAGCRNDCVNNTSFLIGIPEWRRRQIMEKARGIRLTRGSVLFAQEEPVDGIYLLQNGKVKLSTWDSEGREQIIGIFSDPDTIWEGIFMEDSRYPYAAVCLTDVECCKIGRNDLEEAMQDPSVALKIIALLSQKLHDANERVRLLSISSPRARLAGFLLNRSRHTSSDTVVLRLDDIAASIQLRPETVSRRIRELEREGLIEKVGQSSIHIADRAGLEKIFAEE